MKYTDMMTAAPDALAAHYASCRTLAYNNARIAQHGARSARRMARPMGYLMRQIDMCETAARKRGIGL